MKIEDERGGIRKVRYSDRRSLISANRSALLHKRGRALQPHLLEVLPVGVKFPVAFEMMQEDDVRVGLIVPHPGGDEPIPGVERDGLVTVFLDISCKRFSQLPSMEVELYQEDDVDE